MKKFGKWIVVFLVVICIGVAIGGSGGDDDASSTSNTSSKVGSVSEEKSSEGEDAEEETASTKEYHPSDVVSFSDFEISYLSSGEYTDYDEWSEPSKGMKYVVFKFSFKNKGEDDSYIGSFSCYANNKKCEEAYLVADDEDDLWMTELSPGRETSVMYH